jgi:hypothetical protein
MQTTYAPQAHRRPPPDRRQVGPSRAPSVSLRRRILGECGTGPGPHGSTSAFAPACRQARAGSAAPALRSLKRFARIRQTARWSPRRASPPCIWRRLRKGAAPRRCPTRSAAVCAIRPIASTSSDSTFTCRSRGARSNRQPPWGGRPGASGRRAAGCAWRALSDAGCLLSPRCHVAPPP